MKKSLLAVVVGIAMLIPSVAVADSTCGGYSQKTCTTTTTSNTTTSPAPTTHATPAPSTGAASTGAASASTSPSEATTASSGTLPFTGIDVAALMVGASVLLGGGLVIRYLSRDQQS